MNAKQIIASATVGALLTSLCPAHPAAAERLHLMKGHVIGELKNATRTGIAAPTDEVQLGLGVQIDQELMKQTLDRLYGSNVKGSKHFLTSQEFAYQFGLDEKRKKIKDWALANGLTVDPTHNRAESMIVRVSGSAEVVQRALNVRLNHYQLADGRRFRANENDPWVPEAIAPYLSGIMGLSNLKGIAHPHIKFGPPLKGLKAAAPVASPSAPSAAVLPKFAGTGPGGTVAPDDIKTVYGLSGTTLDGTGQTIAIFELDGYDPADVTGYKTAFSLPNVPVTFKSVGGQANLCGCSQSLACNAGTLATGCGGFTDGGMIEVALDIDLVMAIAPGATEILVYEGANDGVGVPATYDAIATDNLASVVSVSWGLYELANGTYFSDVEAPIFQRMAAQGQAVFVASGDNGAYDDGNMSHLSVDDPASQPYVTACGGTTLTGTPSAYTETTWDGSGGGISQIWPMPGYQGGIGGASGSYRNVPDVSLNADPASGYAVYVGGGFYGSAIGGTSAVSPLWTAFMALVNQNRVALGNSVLGFANPALYQIGTSAAYSTLFNDITSGNNLYYSAKSGYDNATGLGGYKGATMINALENVADYISLFSLSNVVAYPNPWDIRRGIPRQMTFSGVPDGGKVKIFTISGFMVKSIPVLNSRAVWDLTNEAGRVVASGLYIYLATNADESHKVVGKVAIIK